MIWLRHLVIVVASVLLGLAVALWSPWAGLAVIVLGFAGFATFQSIVAQRLFDWVAAPTDRPVPSAPGLWGELFNRIARFVTTEAGARDALSADILEIREAIDRLPDALVVLDADNVVQWCNQAARELHGIFADQRPIIQFIRHPDFQRYLSAREFTSPLEIELSARPGRVYEIRIHRTDDDSRLLISRDITEHSMLNQMRSDFVANVSHEIRTPVTVIGGFAETMLDLTLEPAKQREYLESILHHSHTMQRLVEDLLILSTLEAAGRDGLDERIDLQQLYGQLTGEARDLSNGRHDIVMDAPDDVAIIGSRHEIESAVRNFLTNAVRYTPDGGRIVLGWTNKPHQGWITVSDTGIGIATEHIPRLTERFYRVDRGRSRSTGGTGLGLAIVKRIANRHGMGLHVDSKPGVGSTFSLIVPATRIRSVQSTERNDRMKSANDDDQRLLSRR